ncbi:hypothetical protein BMF77_04428 [Dolichospermum sp. UHCC 0315A]|jgi:hypothetical protein|uniref:hypothetical protein n=1 Tax=Dolichospermum TaxID=748770 RepID=UPI00125C0875|nr:MULTISPECIES: hypothetical protein [Dolichospermum]MDB9436972.1 hypothetical protein [Dolichospermum lemmermannii CS-548]QEI43805.1 hypothetical protein BMF77_04428 [Dolichospermum sp. UHCC 0315A]
MRPKSIIELTENLKYLYIKTAKKLKGSDRRQFMAEVVRELHRMIDPIMREDNFSVQLT